MLLKSNENGGHNGVSGHSKSQKSRHKKSQKTATSRDPKICIFRYRGGVSKSLLLLKITTISEIVHMAPRAFKMSVRASKMIARAWKSANKTEDSFESSNQRDQSKLRNGTVAGYARSALDTYIHTYMHTYIYRIRR